MEEDYVIVLCHRALTTGGTSSMFGNQQLLLQDAKLLSMTKRDTVAIHCAHHIVTKSSLPRYSELFPRCSRSRDLEIRHLGTAASSTDE